MTPLRSAAAIPIAAAPSFTNRRRDARPIGCAIRAYSSLGYTRCRAALQGCLAGPLAGLKACATDGPVVAQPFRAARATLRRMRGLLWLEDLRHDVRYAIRTLWRSPGFSAVAIVTLAVGIGATTAIYSIVDTILLRPLPYADSARLVRVVENVLSAGRPSSAAA